jgi:glycolate oxidase iron-sulfur subunit
LDHYELADAIRRRKVADIEATGAATVVTGCPSCRMHIAEGLEKAGKGRPVRHLVDLLAEAYGDSGD